jgi:histidine kinase
MIATFRNYLGAKLFLSYLLVIIAGGVVLALTTKITAPTAFQRHLGMMQGSGEGGMMGMMDGNGENNSGLRRGQGSGFAGELYKNFQQSFSEALTWAALAAGVVALLLSLYLSQRVVRPVRAMMNVSQRIANGDYNERVLERGTDELSQLAQSFNQMAAQLKHTEDLRRQLIGDVAHELRTPLTSIKGSLEGLIDGVLPPSSKTYHQLLQETERLNRLVSDLQELSRVEAGAYGLDLQPVEMGSLVKTVVKRLGRGFEDKNVKLTLDIPDGLPKISVDPDRIIQVLTNLLSNALRYTPSGGEVALGILLHDNHIQVVVRDTGIGIPPEHLPHIFTRFYRVDKSRSRQAGGSGIGLTIAKHLVEAHEGKIWAESQGGDQGSIFFFTLPLSG